MPDRVTVAAPGKLILMGEHAAVYGYPALVTAVDRHLRVTLRRATEASGLRLVLPDLDLVEDEFMPWSELDARTRAAADRWSRWVDAPGHLAGQLSFPRVSADEAVRVAVGEARALVRRLGMDVPAASSEKPDAGVELEIHSQLPVGAGFGSSAAMAVAVVLAWLRWCGVEAVSTPRILAALRQCVLDIERRQHGMPSGVDTEAVLRGGLLWARKREDGVELESVEPANDVLDNLRIFHTGEPVETTGEVVAAVRERRRRDPEAVEEILRRLGSAAERFRHALLQTDDREPSCRRAIGDAILQAEAGLEALSVVPAAVRRWLRQLEAAGGAGKISGAGASSGSAAGCVLVLPALASKLQTEMGCVPDTHDFEPLELSLSAPGALSVQPTLG